jgi:hypothetical protein
MVRSAEVDAEIRSLREQAHTQHLAREVSDRRTRAVVRLAQWWGKTIEGRRLGLRWGWDRWKIVAGRGRFVPMSPRVGAVVPAEKEAKEEDDAAEDEWDRRLMKVSGSQTTVTFGRVQRDEQHDAQRAFFAVQEVVDGEERVRALWGLLDPADHLPHAVESIVNAVQERDQRLSAEGEARAQEIFVGELERMVREQEEFQRVVQARQDEDAALIAWLQQELEQERNRKTRKGSVYVAAPSRAAPRRE